MSRKLKAEKADAVRLLARQGRDQRTIATMLDVSKGYVSSVLTAPRKARRALATAPKAPETVPVPAPDPRAELVSAVWAATDPDEKHTAELALARFEDAELAAELDEGRDAAEALYVQGYPVGIIATARAFASLAQIVSESCPNGFDREDGESEETFAAWRAAQGAAEVERAATLLEDAACLVRAAGPNARWAQVMP